MQEVELKKPALFLATVTLISSVFVLEGSGGEKQTLTVRALSYRAIPHERTAYYHSGGQRSTRCYAGGPYLADSTSFSLHCQTGTTQPENIATTLRSLEVYNLRTAMGLSDTL